MKNHLSAETVLKDYQKILKKVSSMKIMVIGDLILDEYIWGEATRISPEAPVPVIKVSSRTYSAGGAANVACNLRALGVSTSIAGVLGDDGYGRLFRELISEKGIDSSALLLDENRPTTLKTRIMAHSYQIARADSESTDPVDSRLCQLLCEELKKKVTSADLVIISDYGKGVVTSQFLDFALPFLQKKKKKVTVDPKVSSFPMYRGVTTITPNKKEAEGASGINIRDQQSLLSAGKKIVSDLGVEYLLITRGEEGMSLFDCERVYHIPTFARTVYDVTGAGDTVIAHYSACLAAGASPLQSAMLSNIAAGIKVTKLGSAAVTAEEVSDYLRSGSNIAAAYEEHFC